MTAEQKNVFTNRKLGRQHVIIARFIRQRNHWTNDMEHSVITGKNMCSYDEAFTIAEMLEETGLCKKCKLNCPNAGKSESELTDAI